MQMLRSSREAAPDPPTATTDSPAVPPAEGTPLGRLWAVASFGFAVGRADGRLAAAERRQIRTFVERRFSQGVDLPNGVDAVLKDVEAKPLSLQEALATVCERIPPDRWAELCQFATSIADAAGERNAREDECIRQVHAVLGHPASPAKEVANVQVAAPASSGEMSVADCRGALEIAPGTSLTVDLIRRQFNLLSDRLDPTKFAGHGDEFVQVARAKLAIVTCAAKQLIAPYNEPLELPTAPAPTDLRHNPDLDAVFGV